MQVLAEWGLAGATDLGRRAQVTIVVDVLSFSNCVDVACANGARVYPFPIHDREAAVAEALRLNAEIAGKRSDSTARFTLSAPTLTTIEPGARLVLPSPNGSRISHAAGSGTVIAGCLRNADAVARAAAENAGSGIIAVIAAGEHWPDGTLRPAIEDLLGAGAIIEALDVASSPEAQVFRDAYRARRSSLVQDISNSVSGQELRDKGFERDVEIALQIDASDCVPCLNGGAFVNDTIRSPESSTT